MAFTTAVRVRFADTDASGRIHFSAMLRYFEAAEQDFLRAFGAHYGDSFRRGYSFPRVRVECNYTGAIVADDLVDLTLRVERIGRSSYTLALAASVKDRPVADGKLVIVCMDLATEKARPLPPEFTALLSQAGGGE